MWRRWDTSQNFFLTLIDELEKQLFKKLLKGANIKQINFNSYNVAFLKKDKNVWRYYQNLNNMIYISWDIEKTVRQNWKKQILVMLGHFLCPFTPLKTQIIQFWKNEKNCQRYHHFTRVPKIIFIWCTVPEIWSDTDRIFCHFEHFFALLPP